MLKGKFKIKEAVDYFDANYSLEQLPVVRFRFSKPNYFRLYVFYYDDDGESCYTPLYSSFSFESCKRHLKKSFLDSIGSYSPAYFTIESVRRAIFVDTPICCTSFVVNFNFERYESLCNV